MLYVMLYVCYVMLCYVICMLQHIIYQVVNCALLQLWAWQGLPWRCVVHCATSLSSWWAKELKYKYNTHAKKVQIQFHTQRHNTNLNRYKFWEVRRMFNTIIRLFDPDKFNKQLIYNKYNTKNTYCGNTLVFYLILADSPPFQNYHRLSRE